MKERSIPFEASDAVIWTTSLLLAVVIGVGATLGLWMVMRTFSDPLTLAAVIMAISATLSIIVVLFLQARLIRTVLLLIAVCMELTYLIGPLQHWR